MMYPIRTLNLKGYITSYCCSGHGWENKPNTYISFLNKNYVPSILPKGFIIEDDEYYKMMGWNKSNNNVCIRKYYHPIDKYLGEYSYLDRPVLEKEILKTALDLIDWVDKLPYRHEV